MKILVTGAAGFIGSHLAERLIGLGHSVCGIDCFTDYYAKGLKDLNLSHACEKGMDFSDADLATADLSRFVNGIDVVYHVAAQPGISASTPFESYLRNNVIATERLLEAVTGADTLQGFVNISTSSVYGAHASDGETAEPKPTSYYGVTKLTAEQLAMARWRDQAVPACSLRLFSVYGPRERPEKLYPRLIGSILEDRDFPLYEGSEHHVRSYTYVDDVIDGMIAVLPRLDSCVGEIFNIGTDKAITTGEAISIVEDIAGKSARLVVSPKRPGDQLRTQASIEKARRILDYNPRTSVRRGLEKEFEWYKSEIFGH